MQQADFLSLLQPGQLQTEVSGSAGGFCVRGAALFPADHCGPAQEGRTGGTAAGEQRRVRTGEGAESTRDRFVQRKSADLKKPNKGKKGKKDAEAEEGEKRKSSESLLTWTERNVEAATLHKPRVTQRGSAALCIMRLTHFLILYFFISMLC